MDRFIAFISIFLLFLVLIVFYDYVAGFTEICSIQLIMLRLVFVIIKDNVKRSNDLILQTLYLSIIITSYIL